MEEKKMSMPAMGDSSTKWGSSNGASGKAKSVVGKQLETKQSGNMGSGGGKKG